MAKKKRGPRTVAARQDGFVDLEGERYYRIADYDSMQHFFMNIVSDSDLWLFVASNGGVTAGRVSQEHAIFPYVTVDKVYDSVHHTGPLTMIRVRDPRKKRKILWQPFHPLMEHSFALSRSIYKNTVGNKVLFEEENLDLGLVFRYSWTTSGKFGLVRESVLENRTKKTVAVEMLDGVRNILPAGVGYDFQTAFSNLSDAYKWNERIGRTSLAVYILNAATTDRAEPMESLRATTAWSSGLQAGVLLSELQVETFRKGGTVRSEETVRGCRGAYFLSAALSLRPGASGAWKIVLDVDRTQSQTSALRALLARSTDAAVRVDADVMESTERIRSLIGSADGIQSGRRENVTVHHFANVLYNCLRGGIFPDGYMIDRADFLSFLGRRNRPCLERSNERLSRLPEKIGRKLLVSTARAAGDADLVRLCLEYLPVGFSRRHGDPSRPWNRFEIRVRDADGRLALNYQGNWRDIFQNWEALFLSFPDYIENAIAKFVNAMTPDGYNPYRIGRDGIDWERQEPDNPWSYIGYWGDHQVVYLLRFLEWSERFFPGRLGRMLSEEVFSCANVPYRIKPYAEIVKDPRNTIVFDHDLEARIRSAEERLGGDGRLLADAGGSVRHATLAEKLLVILLAKLANFVPGGGIWMNTQRPEWNDANNALAGFGLSMVTLCYLRRFAAFLLGRLDGEKEFLISAEVADLLRGMDAGLRRFEGEIGRVTADSRQRRVLVDLLGEAGSHYRAKVYAAGYSGRTAVGAAELKGFLGLCLEWFDATIRANENADGLYHSYNLILMTEGRAEVRHLYPMLEGQVAAVSSGVMEPGAVVRLLEAMRKGPLYRKDQDSYILYPVRSFPSYLERGIIGPSDAARCGLFAKLVDAGDASLVARDPDGTLRFAAEAVNGKALDVILDRIAARPGWKEIVEKDRAAAHGIYESVFDHHSFTGRSGVMFGYEGIGSVYWHMVAKLLLAVQETGQRSRSSSPGLTARLVGHYRRIAAGLGYSKSAREYGAFPADPYSHTPADAGARQPGMTGQVKEEIISRWGELGLVVENGCVRVDPFMLDRSEFLSTPSELRYYDLNGRPSRIGLAAGDFAFTYCQTPFVYHRSPRTPGRIVLTLADDSRREIPGLGLDAASSGEIFLRTGKVKRVDVWLGGAEQ